MGKSFIDKLAFIELRNKKILVSKSFGKDVWYIPGGKREQGENDLEALIREVKEELNVDLISNTIKPYGVFEAQAHGKSEGVMVRMTCYTGQYEGEIFPGSEIEKIAWFDFLQKLETSIVDHLIFNDLKEKNLID